MNSATAGVRVLCSTLLTQRCHAAAGTVTEDEHILRQWNWSEWSRLVDDSPFALRACYDGNSDARDRLLLDRSIENRPLT